MFGKPKHSKAVGIEGLGSESDYKQRMAELLDTPLHEPRHEEIDLPAADDGLAWAANMETHLWAYEHFAGFAHYVHQFHDPGEKHGIGPWRIELRKDPYINMAGIDDGPRMGLRFFVYYNSCQTGELEIEPGYSLEELPDHFEPANLHINIDSAPLLPYQHVRGFLSVCSERFDEYEERESRQSRDVAILQSLTETMWEAVRNDSIWLSMYFVYFGAVNTKRKFRETT